MLLERKIHTDIKDMLLSNEPFQYAHLIKFERPTRPDSNSGRTATDNQRYTYLTDASRDVPFDDGSKTQAGVANGTRTYLANKILKLSAVTEDTEAKASSYSVTLDGNSLGARTFGTVQIALVNSTTWDITFPINTDLIREGFREGDKVSFSGTVAGAFNIFKFRAKNVVRITRIDATLSVGTYANVTMNLASEEIISVLMDKNAPDYASFVNREVYIYRAYFQSGAVVGTPFLLFKGIISGVGFDDSDTALTVTWNLSSHWGDFSQVRGRITSDDYHRALDQNGVPQPQSAVKVAYAYDKGFSHSETSINILAQYSVQVEKQDVKVKKGFLGIGAKVKVKKYYATEGRNTELDIQLQAKSIPLIYGVRTTSGIPIFADTLNNDSSTVYVIQVLSEGEIGGIYDVYVDGNSLICNDKADFDARSKQTDDDTVQLICRGRADRGDVLGGTSSISTTVIPYYDTYTDNPAVTYKASLNYDLNSNYNYYAYVPPVVTNTDNTGAGIFDGQSISLTSPQKITLDFFSGKPGQKAASSLVAIAKANNFKIQNDYWTGTDTADYWGPNHKLLDTAYVVAKYKIEEGETTIPDTEFVVRGKTLDCYNYDRSYSHHDKVAGENAANFNLGDTVTLRKTDGTILVASTQIIDKWTITRADGVQSTRFRYAIDPPLTYVNGIPTVTRFQMVKGSNVWTMITFNYREVEGAVPLEHVVALSGAANSGGFVRFSYSAPSTFIAGGDPGEQSSVYSVVNSSGNAINNFFFGGAALVGGVNTTGLVTKYDWAAAGQYASSAAGGNFLVRRNVVSLPASSNATNGYYNNYLVTLTRLSSNGKKTVQTKKIISYDGATKIATIDGLWDYGFHPKTTDTVSLTPPYADSRISINPVIQLMDYVTSPVYGRGLDYQDDLNFDSWMTAARKCDEQSNVTVQTSDNLVPAAFDVYRYTDSSGRILWQGRVVGSESGYVEFNEVIGKLTNAHNTWKTFTAGELIYEGGNLYRNTTTGVKQLKPTHTAGTLDGMTWINSLQIAKVSGSGPANLNLVTNGNPVRAVKDGSIIPGYSLYDCDGVDYWRLLGWEEFSQRYATRHQTNLAMDTATPLLDNVNSMLEHFGGILRYSSGQYFLDIEESEGTISSDNIEVHNINAEHIIGKIRLNDEGTRSAFNSLTAAYGDPANKFETRNISFFNSNYLKIDKGVPKKGNLTVPGITNYYNTRMLADKFLNRSRFGLTVSFNMAPRGVLLLAGQVVQIEYPRYGWTAKKFRITNLTHQDDATVDIVADEYDDSFYGLSNISKQAASGLSSNSASLTTIEPPTNLRASNVDANDEMVSGVEVTWDNNPLANSKNIATELYSSYSDQLIVTINSIAGNVIRTTTVHNLQAGELITSNSSIAGLDKKSYFIKEIVSPTQFTISETKAGPVKGLVDMTGVDTTMRTANLIATLPIPVNSYVDVFGGINGRIVKYYWVRYRIVVEG